MATTRGHSCLYDTAARGRNRATRSQQRTPTQPIAQAPHPSYVVHPSSVAHLAYVHLRTPTRVLRALLTKAWSANMVSAAPHRPHNAYTKHIINTNNDTDHATHGSCERRHGCNEVDIKVDPQYNTITFATPTHRSRTSARAAQSLACHTPAARTVFSWSKLQTHETYMGMGCNLSGTHRHICTRLQGRVGVHLNSASLLRRSTLTGAKVWRGRKAKVWTEDVKNPTLFWDPALTRAEAGHPQPNRCRHSTRATM